MSSPLKGGRLSKSEQDTIRSNADISDEELAQQMGRRVEAIREFRKHNLPKPVVKGKGKRFDDFELKNRPVYQSLKRQFSNDELETFEYEWNRMVQQFMFDITPTEELQMQSLISTRILLNRNLEMSKKCRDQQERLELVIKSEYDKTPDVARDAAWLNRIDSLEQQLAGLSQSAKSYTDERVKLEVNCLSYLKEMNLTRGQRKSLANEGTNSWPNLLRHLEEQDAREREGRETALLNLAAQKERDKLGHPHKYINGEWDRPFLNADTVNLGDEEEETSDSQLEDNEVENGEEENRDSEAPTAIG